MGISLRDQAEDPLSNLRFADDVLLFATSLEQLQKMLREFKKSTPRVGLKIHPGKTKILSNQARTETRKYRLTTSKLKCCPHKVLGATIPATGNERSHERNQGSLDIVPRAQTASHLQTLPLTTQTPTLFNMVFTLPVLGHYQNNMKNPINTTQNVPA